MAIQTFNIYFYFSRFINGQTKSKTTKATTNNIYTIPKHANDVHAYVYIYAFKIVLLNGDQLTARTKVIKLIFIYVKLSGSAQNINGNAVVKY